MKEPIQSADLYELRRHGHVLCRGTLKNLGYSLEQLKDMAKNNIFLYMNGKRVKL